MDGWVVSKFFRELSFLNKLSYKRESIDETGRKKQLHSRVSSFKKAIYCKSNFEKAFW